MLLLLLFVVVVVVGVVAFIIIIVCVGVEKENEILERGRFLPFLHELISHD